MPRKALQPPLPLLEPPSTQGESLTAITELLAQRRREYDETNHQLSLLHARIQSERQRADRERKAEEQTWRQTRQAQQTEVDVARQEVARLHRAAQELVDRLTLQNEDSKLRMASLNEREAVLANLNQERLDTAKLRRQAEQQMAEAIQQLQTAQTMMSQAKELREAAHALEAECERRNQAMNEEWNTLAAWRDDLTLQAKNVAIVQAEIDKKLDQLGGLTGGKSQEMHHADIG